MSTSDLNKLAKIEKTEAPFSLRRRKLLIAGGLLGSGLRSRSVQAAMFNCNAAEAWVSDGNPKIPAASFLPYYVQGSFDVYMQENHTDWRKHKHGPEVKIVTSPFGDTYEEQNVQANVDLPTWKNNWSDELAEESDWAPSLDRHANNGSLPDYIKYIRDNGPKKLYVSEMTLLYAHVEIQPAANEIPDVDTPFDDRHYVDTHVFPIATIEFSPRTKPKISTFYRRFSESSRLATCISISAEGSSSPLIHILSKPTHVLSRGGCLPIDMDFS